MKKITAKINTKNGLFIGDPCYVLLREIYYGIWRDKMNYDDGVIRHNDSVCAVVHSTAYGDGNFNGLPVDSATLGISNLDYSKTTVAELKTCGKVIEKTGEIEVELVYYNNGTFWFYVDGELVKVAETGDVENDDNDEY